MVSMSRRRPSCRLPRRRKIAESVSSFWFSFKLTLTLFASLKYIIR
jgi:hypothetical protein